MCKFNRSGFTLVELLVVLSILIVAAVIVIPFISRSNDKDIVSRGARFLQGGIMQCRSRAQLEQGTCGIRLLPSNAYGGLPWYDQFEYVVAKSFVVPQTVTSTPLEPPRNLQDS
jgi:prepilin-type N-terminal cleavage/methylation domain-containing protein